ncbi:phosphatase PAP2 family protein [Pontibacter chitinilyticus]|uniref:phosphatase PAP2 family protein n=1 Tax=Pontibacter chitinilyticus TaxID=2674989 RepID=UPI003219E0E8
MKRQNLILVQLLWLSIWLAPAPVQAQVQQNTAADTASVIPADSVLPGQKHPFTDAQRLEGSDGHFLKRAVIPAAALVAAGLYTIHGHGIISSFDARDLRNRKYANFSTKIDNYLFFTPMVGLFAFDLLSSQNRHDLGRQAALLAASGVLTTLIVFPTKEITNVDRPNGDPTAFPSGHTAFAFTVATMVDKEFRHKSPWISIGSYTVASATGVMRILNNKHWLADVLAGAGVGILSVNTVYWLNAKMALKKQGYNTAVLPTVLPTGQPGMAILVQF